MAKKEIKIHNKSDKPDNIVKKEARIFQECEEIENELPCFQRLFPLSERKCSADEPSGLSSRYPVFLQLSDSGNRPDKARTPGKITLQEFGQIRAADVNLYLDYCRKYKVETERASTYTKTTTRRWRGKNLLFPLCSNSCIETV